jgi:hypothetical protein
MPRPASVRRLALAAAVLCVLACPAALQAQQKDAPTKKYALLVGCTTYQLEAIDALAGPGNDVPRFAEVLEGLGFPKENITRYVGWPRDPRKRASYANIIAGFEDLVKKAGRDTQIVILLAGHGDQVPIPKSRKASARPRSLKLDGMDRVFLPADVKEWQDDQVKNAIIDDTIGNYLDAMAQKGAAVWIILDCCHSGTMARDVSKGDVERVREVRRGALKIPKQAYEEAAERARELRKHLEAQGEKTRSVAAILDKGMLQVEPRKTGKGSVVAFYACQPYEKAPELVRPAGMPLVDENYYGLLSYTLTSMLQAHAKAKLTYRELAQMLVASYQAERGSRAPTPFAEGDLDREVLGMKVWPKRAQMILQHADGKLRIGGGGVLTLTDGTVLAVYPPKDDKRDPKVALGHVKVVGLTAFHADVEPCAHGKLPLVAADKLPARGPCTVVSQDLGDMRLPVAVGKRPDAGKPPTPEERKRWANLTAALDGLPEATAKLIRKVEDQARADWVLWVEDGKVELRQGDGRASIDLKEEYLVKKAASEGKPVSRLVFAEYDADDVKVIAAGLDRDLQKIFSWRNLWRIAGTLGARGEEESADLKVELLKLKEIVPKKQYAPDGKVVPGAALRPGDFIELRVSNTGREDLWVAILFMDANCGIKQLDSRTVKAGEPLRPIRGPIDATSEGREGFVILSVPVKAQRVAPDFRFLEQDPLRPKQVREKSRAVRLQNAQKGPQTPFQRLLTSAAFGGEQTRGFDMQEPTTPNIQSVSWRTAAPPAAAKQP